jgi:hypothetical protein
MKLIMENWRRFLILEKSRGYLRKKDIKLRSSAEDKEQFGYIFGTIYGEKLEAVNEADMFYGASMPKPILALAAAKAMGPISDEKIQGLLNYVGRGNNDSNKVFSFLHKKMGKKTKQYIDSTKVASDISSAPKEQERELGLTDQRMDIVNSWSRNKQSPLQFFNFLVFLKKFDYYESHPDPEIKEIQRVLSVMKREYFGESRKDRELKGFKNILSAMQNAGLPVTNIYGKGGRDAGALNYGIVIDDKYIMVIYTDISSKHADTSSKSKVRNFIHEKIIEVYSNNT